MNSILAVGVHRLKDLAKRTAGKFPNLCLVNNAAYWDRHALFWILTGKSRKGFASISFYIFRLHCIVAWTRLGIGTVRFI